jgi:single-stranded DNA-binding protein
MAKYNEIYIEGNLGRAPSFKPTAGGNNLCTFPIGHFQGKEKPTLWLMVKTIGLVPELGKGDKVGVRGRLAFETWKKPDGTESTLFLVWADSITVLQRKEAPMPKPEVATDDDAPF